MNLNYQWDFNPLELYPTASGQTDVVFKVYWYLTATTGSYSARATGNQIIQYTPGSSFTPFNELTPEIVYNWVSSSMSEEEYNNITTNLIANIENQINPPVVIQQAPWLAQQQVTPLPEASPE